ncbi:hypothetical protein ACLOJK_037083 [Asimina triloba]
MRKGPGKSEPRKRIAVRPGLGLGSTNVRVNFRRQKLHAPSSAWDMQHVVGNGATGPSSGAAVRLGPKIPAAFRFGSRALHRRAKVLGSRNCTSGSPYAPAQARELRTSGSTSGAHNFAHRHPHGTCRMSLEMTGWDLRWGQLLRGWGRPPGPKIAVWRPLAVPTSHDLRVTVP